MAGGFIGQAVSYGKAYMRWVSAGQPVRSPEEQQRILTEVCAPCQFFRPNQSNCSLCGCGLKLGTGKILLGTESCPASPPKWTAMKTETRRERRRRERVERRRLARRQSKAENKTSG